MPNSRFSKASPNGRFIKAEAAKWLDIQIGATGCKFHSFPHNQFISRRAKQFLANAAQWPFRKSRPSGRFIKASANCRFIKADAIKSFWQSHFQQKQAQ